MNMEKREEEKHTASDSPSVDEPPSPHPHQEHNSLSPPESSPADSPVSYRTSHGFSPKEYKTPPTPPTDMPATSPSPVVVVNRSVRDEPRIVTKVDLGAVDGIASIGVEERGGASARRGKLSLSILRRPKRERAVERAALGFRVCGFLFCLVSFSIMASDKNRGWTLDSFDRYKEFRYCLAVNVIGFAYSGLQGCDLAYHLGTRQHALRQHLRYHLDFFMDQLLGTSWLASIFRSFPSCPGTNNSNQTWRFPTFHLGSSSLAHFASLMQSCFGSAGQTRAGSPLFYDFGISFSCKASLLQHNPRKDLVCQFGCHTWKPEVSFLS